MEERKLLPLMNHKDVFKRICNIERNTAQKQIEIFYSYESLCHQ